MDAKLIKTFYGYELLTQGFVKGSTNHELIDSLNIEEGTIRYKLSLKNCESIERGYDLDELAYNYSTMNMFIYSRATESPTIKEIEDAEYISEIAFKEGFQKALSILGDKKFTYNQMVSAITESSISHRLPSLIIQDLQQTEWDVIIEMDTDCTGEFKYLLLDKGTPKLDADGNLILKRKI